MMNPSTKLKSSSPVNEMSKSESSRRDFTAHAMVLELNSGNFEKSQLDQMDKLRSDYESIVFELSQERAKRMEAEEMAKDYQLEYKNYLLSWTMEKSEAEYLRKQLSELESRAERELRQEREKRFEAERMAKEYRLEYKNYLLSWTMEQAEADHLRDKLAYLTKTREQTTITDENKKNLENEMQDQTNKHQSVQTSTTSGLKKLQLPITSSEPSVKSTSVLVQPIIPASQSDSSIAPSRPKPAVTPRSKPKSQLAPRAKSRSSTASQSKPNPTEASVCQSETFIPHALRADSRKARPFQSHISIAPPLNPMRRQRPYTGKTGRETGTHSANETASSNSVVVSKTNGVLICSNRTRWR